MDNPIRAAAAGSARGVCVCECFFLLGVFILEGALLMPRHTHTHTQTAIAVGAMLGTFIGFTLKKCGAPVRLVRLSADQRKKLMSAQILNA